MSSISSKATLLRQDSVAATTKVPTNSYSVTKDSWKAEIHTFLSNPIIDFSNGCPGFNPCSFLMYVDGYQNKVSQIHYDKWDFRHIRETHIVVATTTGSNLKAVFQGTVNSGLDMRGIRRCNNKEWFWD
ncbi:hypothetical protein PanWU01x14_309620 [Parasponia andersonii]|uniref:Uncharacterized protein n=1 Tax=Parasponia andersonii TaxID=3476 RepID=A0A2P5AQL0_PARAD|nr:hypothetical protein PanWU01x14_309620 [Parasponia andersonii]